MFLFLALPLTCHATKDMSLHPRRPSSPPKLCLMHLFVAGFVAYNELAVYGKMGPQSQLEVLGDTYTVRHD